MTQPSEPPPPSHEPSPYCLFVIRSAAETQRPGTSIPVPAGGGVLGRSPEADVVFADQSISRRHVTAEVTAEGLRIRPLTSSNGTFVAGNRVQVGESVLLRVDDRLQLGGVILSLTSNLETEPVLEPLDSRLHEAPIEVTWDAGHCVIRINGRVLPLSGNNAAFFGLVAEAEGKVVNGLDFEETLGISRGSIAPLAHAARTAVAQVLEEGVLDREFVVSRAVAAGSAVAPDATPHELARAFIENRRNHGYLVHLRSGDVRVVHV